MQTSFTILVTGSPTNSQAHLSALRFIRAALTSKHKIESVFFYQEAVHVANRFIIKPSDEAQLTQIWAGLSEKHSFELQVCVAASNRRGVLSTEEASANNIESSSLHSAYSVLGLGQLAASIDSIKTKLVQFK